jgi:hypothetical protein
LFVFLETHYRVWQYTFRDRLNVKQPKTVKLDIFTGRLASACDDWLLRQPNMGVWSNWMTIAFAAVHQSLRYRAEDTGLYVVAFADGTMFVSRRQPRLYDASARPIAPREVVPETYVYVRYHERRGRKWMEAIQLVREPEEEPPPFGPILDDGHL